MWHVVWTIAITMKFWNKNRWRRMHLENLRKLFIYKGISRIFLGMCWDRLAICPSVPFSLRLTFWRVRSSVCRIRIYDFSRSSQSITCINMTIINTILLCTCVLLQIVLQIECWLNCFEYWPGYLTNEKSERVRYRIQHEKKCLFFHPCIIMFII